jgi:hypothetical protein
MTAADIIQLVTAILGFGALIYPWIVKGKKTILMWVGVVLLVVNLAVFIWRYWGDRILPDPQVTINANVEDEIGNAIDKNSAPYAVYVRGTVANAEGLFLYLVVDDGNAEWIQPGLGPVGHTQFAELVYLGEPSGDASLKRYRVFAVVVNKEHKVGDHLDNNTVKVYSNVVELIRTR